MSCDRPSRIRRGEGVPEAMYFCVMRFVRWSAGGALKAFCDVAVDRRLLIKGIRVVEGRHGHFVSMPRVQNKDERWREVIVPLTRETKTELSRIILEEFQKHHS